ncbi:Polynucleotidyl transferase, ribonuclease H-like superfamily protein [Prunus dulcis]|uniref:Polynucleotidyl transferase, ribonuclease H-like superfamily protein n=2 Tax=Prunus dulcis TaxID=3755 RepID=A0A5H2XQZ6_PRUDU|nr:Polynucleotidyl transferase, ribonuclease H-like superfamily protein [Prunus dulcis]
MENHNNLYGEISHNWGQCLKLKTILMARNNVSGSTPPEIRNATQIHVLDLSSNHLVVETDEKIAINDIVSDNEAFGVAGMIINDIHIVISQSNV